MQERSFMSSGLCRGQTAADRGRQTYNKLVLLGCRALKLREGRRGAVWFSMFLSPSPLSVCRASSIYLSDTDGVRIEDNRRQAFSGFHPARRGSSVLARQGGQARSTPQPPRTTAALITRSVKHLPQHRCQYR